MPWRCTPIEFLLLFFIGPTLFVYTRHRIPANPMLWALTAYCLFILLHDPAFDRGGLWNTAPLGQYAPAILGLFAAAVALGIALTLRFGSPGRLRGPSLPQRIPKAVWPQTGRDLRLVDSEFAARSGTE